MEFSEIDRTMMARCIEFADEAMQAWSDWRPLATQAIRLFGFFVKPKVGKINADGL